jgi:hypothetical protein
MTKNYITATDVIAITTPKIKEIEVEGFTMFVRAMTAYEMAQLALQSKKSNLTEEESGFILISKSIYNQNNEQVFTLEQAKNLNFYFAQSLIEAIEAFNKTGPNAIAEETNNLKNETENS